MGRPRKTGVGKLSQSIKKSTNSLSSRRERFFRISGESQFGLIPAEQELFNSATREHGSVIQGPTRSTDPMLLVDYNEAASVGTLNPVDEVLGGRNEFIATQVMDPNIIVNETEEDATHIDPFSLLGKISPEFHRGAQYILNWPTLYALFEYCGSTSVKKRDYNNLRFMWEYARNMLQNSATELTIPRFPHYDTINETLRPWLIRYAWVKSTVICANVSFGKSGARVISSLGRTRLSGIPHIEDKAPFMVVNVSEYARADLTNPLIYSLLTTVESSSKAFANCPLMFNRYKCIKGHNESMGCFDNNPITTRVYPSDVVDVQLEKTQNSVDVDPIILRAFDYSSKSTNHGVLLRAIHCRSELVGTERDASHQRYQNELSEQETNLIRKMSEGYEHGDHISLLRPSCMSYSKQFEFNYFLCICSRTGPPRIRQEAMILKSKDNEISTISGLWNVASVLLSKLGNDPKYEGQAYRSYGLLPNGTPYVKYPFWMYCDDFRESFYKTGSAGGCYMLPVGLPREARKGSSAVRVLSLTGPGVSTNEALKYLFEDIVKGSIEGIREIDSSGKDYIIFLDCLGFISDYIACQHTLDVMGVASDVPCHLCSTKRGDKHSSSTQFGFEGFAVRNSSSDCLFRSSNRVELLRSRTGFDKNIAKYYGVKYYERSTPYLPWHNLEDLLKKGVENVPTSQQDNIVSTVFDPYQSNMIGVEHMLTGLARNALDNAFQSLRSDIEAEIVEKFILYMIRTLGLRKQTKIYNYQTQGTNSMELSQTYAVLHVAPLAFAQASRFFPDHAQSSGGRNSIASQEQRRISIELLTGLKEIVGLTFEVGPEYGTIENNKKLLQLSTKYISNLNLLVSTTPAKVRNRGDTDNHFTRVKSRFRPRDTLDNKPNLHRLQEAFLHTIPAVGSALEIAELPFETKHQEMKRGIAKGGPDPQITSMISAIANYWKSHLVSVYYLVKEYRETLEKDNFLSENEILHYAKRTLFGSYGLSEGVELSMNDLETLFQKPLSRLLEMSSSHLFTNFSPNYRWIATTEIRKRVDNLGSHNFQDNSTAKEQYLLHCFGEESSGKNTPDEDVILYKGARFMPTTSISGASMRGEATTANYSKHFEICEGSAVTANVTKGSQSKLLTTDLSVSATVWGITKLFSCTTYATLLYAEAYPVIVSDDMGIAGSRLCSLDKESSSFYLPLTNDIKKVGLVHACSPETCELNVGSFQSVIKHSSRTIVHGGSWHMFLPSNGYPPRSA